MNRLYERITLTICAIALSAIAVRVVAVPGSVQASTPAPLEELTVKRLRIVDASGVVRLSISGKPLPDAILEGKVVQGPPRDRAGLMFYNEHGDEQGGLSFQGSDGEQGGNLSFDAWHQDAALEIQHSDTASQSDSYIVGSDLPKASLLETSPLFNAALKNVTTQDQRNAVLKQLRAKGLFRSRRFVLGEISRVSQLGLNDARGQQRLRLSVTPEGDAAIQFLDSTGKIVKTLSPTHG